MASVCVCASSCLRFANLSSTRRSGFYSLPIKNSSSSSRARRLLTAQCNYRPRFRAFGNKADSMTIRSVPVQVAHDLLNAGHHYLDVRTPEEFAAGHVDGAVNIALMHKSAAAGMSKNPEFINEVASRFHRDDEIVVGCQSGRRSMIAANELIAAGFTGVTDMGGGYAAWLQSNLPVAQ